VAWAYHSQTKTEKVSKTVFLATPKQLNKALHVLSHVPLISELQTASGWFAPGLCEFPSLPQCCYAISGTRDFGTGYLLGLDRKNDGLIEVDETLYGHASQSTLVHRTHIGVVISKMVVRSIASWLHGEVGND
jgi:hypothetical protein